MSAHPFDSNQLVYRHCFDLSTKNYVPTAGFPCLEVCCVLGHFSFTFGGKFRVGLWKAASEAKPVGMHEKRSFDQSKFQLWI